MTEIGIEQARFRRADNGPPYLQLRSPGFHDDWLPQVERLLVGFGIRVPGVACLKAVFAQPLGIMHVVVVHVADRADPPELLFHVFVCPRPDYEQFLGDPFALVRRFPAAWDNDSPLASLTAPRGPVPARTIAQVQAVLRRVKAGALKENEDPEHPDFQRTPDNSESPALLGGVQVLVEGGKLVFERPAPDPDLVEGLWTLLPQSTRARLWPATFAFSNALGFDVLVVPRLHASDFEGYTAEHQAAEYPAGHYEIALQVAAETGNQRELDALLNRRSGRETLKLGWTLLLVVMLLTLAPRFLDLFQPPPTYLGARHRATIAAAVAMTGGGNPWTALALEIYDDSVPKFKAAAAAGMIAGGDPWTALALKLCGDKIWSGP